MEKQAQETPLEAQAGQGVDVRNGGGTGHTAWADDVAAGNTNLPVLIIGAGSAGLALAQGLRKNNIPAIVFERDTSLDPGARRRWSFAMAWSAHTLQGLIPKESWDRIQTAFSDPSLAISEKGDNLPIFNGATGEIIGGVPWDKVYRLYRPRFRKFMAEGIDVRFEKRLSDISFDESAKGVVVAHFEDGTSERGRLLIGADGAKSRTRALLLGQARGFLTRLPFAAAFFEAKFPREKALYLRGLGHPLLNVVPHPDNLLAMFGLLQAPDPDVPEEWVFIMYIGFRVSPEEQDAVYGKWTRTQHLKHSKELATRFADPIRSAFGWLPDVVDGGENLPITATADIAAASAAAASAAPAPDATSSSRIEDVFYVSLTSWDPRPAGHVWDTHGGLVTLAGDSAHPMTYRLNNAIEDAGQLTRVLSKIVTTSAAAAADGQSHSPSQRGQQGEAIREYEAEMRARGGREVEISEASTWMMHNWTMIMSSPLVTRGLDKPTPETAKK